MAFDPRTGLDVAKIRSDLINAVGYRVQFEILSKLNSVIASGTKGATNQMAAIATEFANRAGNAPDMERVHKKVADDARKSVLRSYAATVTARKKVPSYREGDNRYSGGALLRALNDPSMIVGTEAGIQYINQDVLNKEARHWQRLNFGAGGVGGNNPPGRWPVLIDERVVFTLGFTAGPRPAFSLPVGMFLDEEGKRVGRNPDRRGTDRFQPTKKAFLPNPTRGIEARQFLDAGLRTISEELPGLYKTLVDNWALQAANARPTPTPPIVP